MSDFDESEDTPPPEPETFDFSKLRYLHKSKKIDRMRDWFFTNYEDPSIQMPYDSESGGYVYIDGGPYDAYDVLHDAFDEYVASSIIDELADELTADCPEWAPVPSEDDFEDWLARDVGQISEYRQVFVSAWTGITRLLKAELPEADAVFVHRLLFANVITALETYLADAFSTTVLADPALVRKFVETTPSFKQEKFSIAEIYSEMEGMEKRVKSELTKVMWHDLSKVSGMYRDTLGIVFPKNLGPIYRAIVNRHHIVHRNGKDLEGNSVNVYKDDVDDLLAAVIALVEDIDNKLPKPEEPEAEHDLPF
jgi:hypothetical protein